MRLVNEGREQRTRGRCNNNINAMGVSSPYPSGGSQRGILANVESNNSAPTMMTSATGSSVLGGRIVDTDDSANAGSMTSVNPLRTRVARI